MQKTLFRTNEGIGRIVAVCVESGGVVDIEDT